MTLKASISKSLLVASLLLLAAAAPAAARPLAEGDSVMVSRTELDRLRYNRYVKRYQKGWMKLIPNLATLQYAGDIGMFSLGIGWDYGKHDRWETHFLIGYLPKYHADAHDATFTLKENFIPWCVNVTDGVDFNPACFTLFFNTIFDDEFWTEQPDRYPSGYYGFSSRVRIALGFGGRINFKIPDANHRHTDRLSLYYELNTCDLLIVSAVTNSNITLGDILRLGIGIQYRIF